MILLAAAWTAGRAVHESRGARTGFEPAGVFAISIDVPASLPYEQQVDLYPGALAAIRRVRGVDSAAAGSAPPLTGSWQPLSLSAGSGAAARYEAANVSEVTPGYFATLRIPLIAGRDFRAGDGTSAMVVDAAFVSAHGLADPIGKEVRMRMLGAGSPQSRTIVGVVGSVWDPSLDPGARAMPHVYVENSPALSSSLTFLVRGQRASVGQAQRLLQRLEPDSAVYGTTALTANLHQIEMPQRIETAILAALVLLSLALGTASVWAAAGGELLAHRRESAVRLALGAPPGPWALGSAARASAPALAGAAAGAVCAWGLQRLLDARGVVFPHCGLSVIVCVAALAWIAAGLLCLVATVGRLRAGINDLLRAS